MSDTTDRVRTGISYGTVPKASETIKQDIPVQRPRTSSFGLLLVLTSQFFASLMALATRYLSMSLPPGENFDALHILFVRMTITVAFSLVWMWWNGVKDAPFGPKEVRWLLICRGIAGFLGVWGLYFSLKYLELGDSTAIVFLVPIFVSLLASWIPSLHERFTISEMCGAVVSLVGVMLIARPTFLFPGENKSSPGDVPPFKRTLAVIAALINVVGAAFAYTLIRMIGKRAHPLVSVTYFSGTTVIGSTLGLLFIPSLGGFKVPHGVKQWLLLLAIGVTGFAMQFLLTKGLQLTTAGSASALMYTQIVFAVFFEWAVWGNLPTRESAIGGALILISVISVESIRARRKKEDVDAEAAASDATIGTSQERLLNGERD